MPAAPARHDEADRLKFLEKAAILDTPPDALYDGVVQLLSLTTQFPVAFVSLVDETRGWLKAKVGHAGTQLRRDQSFCAHIVASRKPLVVCDAQTDPDFCDNELVTGGPKYRCYVGFPIAPPSAGGHCLGTLCVLDFVPHESIPDEVLRVAAALADNVSAFIDSKLRVALEEDKLSVFLSKISHELRTPLHAVMGQASLLKPFAEGTSEVTDLVDSIVTVAEGALQTVNHILDFALLQFGKAELQVSEFDLRSCVESAFEAISTDPKAPALQFACVQNQDALVYGDSARIRQMLWSLLSNAVKFTHSGSVVLTCTAREAGPHVDVTFAVQDTGIGMSPDEWSQVMNRFDDLPLHTPRKCRGTGLGLVVTESLCQLMGSALELESASGQGSTFSFTLTMKGGLKVAPPETAGKAVLIVDSAPDVLVSHCKSLAMKVVSRCVSPPAARRQRTPGVAVATGLARACDIGGAAVVWKTGSKGRT